MLRCIAVIPDGVLTLNSQSLSGFWPSCHQCSVANTQHVHVCLVAWKLHLLSI